MKISKRGEYGVRAVCHLARRYGAGVVHVREIARAESIPAKFLEGILLQLKRSGVLVSRRGIEGGYALAHPPEEIVLGHVLRILDGPLAPMGSAAELMALMEKNPRHAGFYAVLKEVRDASASILDGTSLADLVARDAEIERS